MNSKNFILLMLLVLHLPAPASAEQTPERCPFSVALERQDVSYQEKMGNMFARGALNAGFGWTEVIMQPTIEAKKNGNVISGIFRGIGQGLTRTANGVGEIFTFWTPKVGGRYITFSTDSPLDMYNDELEAAQPPPPLLPIQN